MLKKINIKSDRILILAVLISLVWHVFWLSAVKIVAPGRTGPARFSRVAFLGPILSKGGVEVGIAPKPSSFLEKRYIEMVVRPYYASWVKEPSAPRPYEGSYTKFHAVTTEKSSAMIDEALNTQKLEPTEIY